MLQSSSVEHRTIALDEGIKPSQRSFCHRTALRLGDSGALPKPMRGESPEICPCNFNCELMKMNGNKQEMV